MSSSSFFVFLLCALSSFLSFTIDTIYTFDLQWVTKEKRMVLFHSLPPFILFLPTLSVLH